MITELCVLDVEAGKFVLVELAPEVTVEQVQELTEAIVVPHKREAARTI